MNSALNLAELAIRAKTVTLAFALVLLVGGVTSFMGLARLEDPELTIKDALVVTPYPGASAAEVEAEVSDRVEQAAQALAQTKHVRSNSMPGMSIVKVTIEDHYDSSELPQVWDELRRKVTDIQGQLPPGAGPSVVNDDFGDVYGVFVAITGPEYAPAELEEYAKQLRRELLLVEDVAKVELVAAIPEVVYVEMSAEAKLQTGLSPEQIGRVLGAKSLVADGGRVAVGPEFVRIEPSGGVRSVADYEAVLIENPQSGALVRLGDVATIRRGYRDPPAQLLRVDGERALGLAISTAPGGNVVTMGEALTARAAELDYLRPHGVDFHVIALQSRAVTAAIDAFTINLAAAVGIVIVVLLLFMGLRSGLIIGGVLVLTISGTFILMAIGDIALQRISLGALVIALGMLVDNAIVVTDGTLAGLARGQTARMAAVATVKQTATPLLIATLIAIASFAAIGTSDDATGEYCGSLYQVLLYSLSLSWVTAMTVTPVLCVMFLRPPRARPEVVDRPERPRLAGAYERVLAAALRRRGLTLLVAFGLLVAAVVGFGQVDQSFFPDSTRPQFMVDYFAPRGTHIEQTELQLGEIEAWIGERDGVTQVATVVGQGAPRFLLTYAPEEPDSGYGQIFVEVDDYAKIPGLQAEIQAALETRFVDGEGNTKLFMLGPGEGGKIQIRLSGPDPDRLRALAGQVMDILEDAGARGVRNDWRERVEALRPLLAEEPARLAGVDRRAVAEAIHATFEGRTIGVYREGDRLLPLIARAPEHERDDVAQLGNAQVWSPTARRWIPIRQVVAGVTIVEVDDLIRRRDRIPTMTIHADPPLAGLADQLLARVVPDIEAIDYPQGYGFELGGEYEKSSDARAAMALSVVLFGVLMILMTIVLFNAVGQALVIWLCVPLSIVGVTAGLLITDNPFGFMATLGLLSLVGMMIKNSIVLIDEIDLQIGEGVPRFAAVIAASASRVRPVGMAALTTMLGMIPLFTDAFFVSMAVTIVFGLGFATILTLLVVPVVYATVFRVAEEEV
ncbi:Cobalt-zinc-cadmium resistance protein CzcA [Enhygromyxa salina]|uniref:Cobalt-zinc-cadmium resistance protein CzcA n=1 Tax=Enhygromyxa salina TaxID=215803 RepID=A0A2S9YK21_9BACT|nr:efflux RND transporter permease subunit [Enhygromyxa salina]PRQ05441.1 Cobalt-zinc-cadmium resistance protein CzcA [Enhygromyxa salina]